VEGRDEKLVFSGYKASVWEDENVLEGTVKMAAKQ
jgi:hypothetical protein